MTAHRTAHRFLPVLLSLAFACGDDDGGAIPDGGFPVRDGAPAVPDAGRGTFEPAPGELACDPAALPIEADPTRGAWDGSLYVPGVGGRSDLAVTALAALPDDDDAVLVGGTFDAVGRVRTRNVALWTGERWRTFGEGVDGDVTALAAGAGGVFYVAIRDPETWGGRVLRWSDDAWTSIGATPAEIAAMELAPDGRLWIGGWFDLVDEVVAPYLAVWNGTAWSAPDEDAPDAGVSAIAHHEGTTCVAGDFGFVGELETMSGACLREGTWEARPFLYPFYQVNALTFDDEGGLYAAGTFPIENPEDYDYGGGIAHWRDGAWRLVGAGVHSDPAGPGRVEGVGVIDGQLYATGGFVAAGFRPDAIPVNDAARYDLERGVWDDVRGGLGKIRGISLIGTNALALEVTRSGLVYFGGLFSLAGDRAASRRLRPLRRWALHVRGRSPGRQRRAPRARRGLGADGRRPAGHRARARGRQRSDPGRRASVASAPAGRFRLRGRRGRGRRVSRPRALGRRGVVDARRRHQRRGARARGGSGQLAPLRRWRLHARGSGRELAPRLAPRALGRRALASARHRPRRRAARDLPRRRRRDRGG
ncbi:MAG: hypothetical protein MUE69_28460 [Myxococcota bacterium]|nr:hypothetical protein [Myxococcota bacterium]